MNNLSFKQKSRLSFIYTQIKKHTIHLFKRKKSSKLIKLNFKKIYYFENFEIKFSSFDKKNKKYKLKFTQF